MRRTLSGARRAAIGSTDLRSPASSSPVQYSRSKGTARPIHMPGSFAQAIKIRRQALFAGT
jgi:hypothetical protein